MKYNHRMTKKETVIEAPGYITPGQAAKRSGIRLGTIYSAMERGAIPYARIEGTRTVLLLQEDFDNWKPLSHGGPRDNAGKKKAAFYPEG